MTRGTSDLIRRLAADGDAVRPLPSPWQLLALWLAVSLPYFLLFFLVWPRLPIGSGFDDRFVIQQLAALATAIAAAYAAFATMVPGSSRAIALIPLGPLAVWVGNLGVACAHDVSTASAISPVLPYWGCLPITLVAGLIPTIVMIVMLRRGAPLTPHLTIALGGLAGAAAANVAIRFIHAVDASLVVLTWHVAAVLAISVLLSTAGHRLLPWPRVGLIRR
jgi:hypothetical protein